MQETNEAEETLLTVRQAAEILEVPQKTLLDWIKKGKIAHYQISRYRPIRLDRKDVLKAKARRQKLAIKPE